MTYKYAADAPAFIKSDLEVIVNAPSSSDSGVDEDEDEDEDDEAEAESGANANANSGASSATDSAAIVFANVEKELEDELPKIFSLGQDYPEIEHSLEDTIQMIKDNEEINPDLEMIIDADDIKFINF